MFVVGGESLIDLVPVASAPGAERQALERFLALVREKNPDALIVWAYGMLGFEMEPYILKAFEKRKAAGDSRVLYFRMPAMEPGEEGSRDHPGYPIHRRAAEAVAAYMGRVWK